MFATGRCTATIEPEGGAGISLEDMATIEPDGGIGIAVPLGGGGMFWMSAIYFPVATHCVPFHPHLPSLLT